MDFVELNNDQGREQINTRQRYQALRNAQDRERGYRGSMVWETTRGNEYLLKSYYDENGKRRQKSLGRRSADTEAVKLRFEAERESAAQSRKSLSAVMDRQASINRALGLGRVPLIAARILRLLDKRGMLGHGIRVAGTNALFCYEAACGVFVDASITTTQDIDLLFDSRSRLHLIGDPDLSDDSLLQLLQLADRSFRRTRQTFRAANDEGYLVDLIKPVPSPPWRPERSRLSNSGGDGDLEAAEIAGLEWLENAPSFEQMAIDIKGYPLRIATVDPRVFAIHKFWLATREDRDRMKLTRDRAQAFTVAAMVRRYLQHLPFDAGELRMLPKAVVDDALDAFAAAALA